MKRRNKSFAFSHYADVITRSWTFLRMTEEEKNNWIDLVHNELEQGHIFGNYDQRIKIMNGLYHAYLVGIGYTDFNWRENTLRQTKDEINRIHQYPKF